MGLTRSSSRIPAPSGELCMTNLMALLEISYLRGRFAEERKRYLGDLLKRGWKLNTVRCIASKLEAFSARVDITCKAGVTTDQINAAADAWMKEARHLFGRPNGPHIARTKFIN